MKHRLPIAVLAVCLIASLAASAAAGNWSRFQGPNGQGISEDTTIPPTWTTKDYAWRVKLPGPGHSSPVVWDDKIFVTSGLEEDATQIVRCLRTSDGGLIWKRYFPSSPHHLNKSNAYASSTPAIDADHLYLTFATPEHHTVMALDVAKGRPQWTRDLGPFESQHGFGASPMLFEDMLIVPNEQDGPSSIVALDRMTGDVRWKADRESDRAAYATPCIWRPEGGRPQLILHSSAHGIGGLDPYTGQSIWEHPIYEHRVVASPTIAAGLIIGSCGTGGVGKQMFAVRPADPARDTKSEIAYELTGRLPYVPTSVTKGDLLFTWFDHGEVTCVEAPTGRVRWSERVGGDYYSSPVRAGNHIYCASRAGEMVVIAAEDRFKLLGRINLEEPSHATPAIADGVMYIRTLAHLMAIEGKKDD